MPRYRICAACGEFHIGASARCVDCRAAVGAGVGVAAGRARALIRTRAGVLDATPVHRRAPGSRPGRLYHRGAR